jgi:hypothetical protein
MDLPDAPTFVVTRPKTETVAFPLIAGQKVAAGVVRFRILRDPASVANAATKKGRNAAA